ncbi:hypothetical protein [Pseudonocardia spinosispora]|uniref:hypothetical protein n=1 Tax=Pseudonocardia spinosispora TaxID=103441 RepID=UPI0004216183|nr:hypothetical protein [Pseudonocardia spinosispora]
MRTIHVETELPTSADAVWQAMQHAESLRYVTQGLFKLPALAGRTQPFRQGESGTSWLVLFHVLPAWRHTIRLELLDHDTRTMRSQEHGGVIKGWRHTLHVEPIDSGRCRYSDTVDVDAGGLTGVVAAIGTLMYRIRQRRWQTLTRTHLLASGPSWATAEHLPQG